MDLLLLSTVVKLLLLSSGGLLSGGDLYGRLLITESHPWDEERLLHVHVFVTEVGAKTQGGGIESTLNTCQVCDRDAG